MRCIPVGYLGSCSGIGAVSLDPETLLMFHGLYEMNNILTHACLKEEQYWLWSSMFTRCGCVESRVDRAMGLPAVLGEDGGGEYGPRMEREKKQKEFKIAAVQITHPKGFDFSNTAES